MVMETIQWKFRPVGPVVDSSRQRESREGSAPNGRVFVDAIECCSMETQQAVNIMIE